MPSTGGGFTLSGSADLTERTKAIASADGRFSLAGGVFPDHVPPRCPADFADPPGVLDLADIISWIGAFENGDREADYAPPYGVLDLGDIVGFVGAFTAGCP